MKVAHLTSVHPRNDTRIFLKMCLSLAKKKYDINLVVADGLGDDSKNGVKILDVGGKSRSRLKRMFKSVMLVYKAAKKLDADIYHLHDPELIPIGLRLKMLGKIVIFDAHEDLPKQLRSKPYLNKYAGRFLSSVFEVFENIACKKFDAIIAATPFITEKFCSINSNSININNYPILDELASTVDWASKKNEVCYLGGISKIRGIKEVIKALKFSPNVSLNLAGKFTESSVEAEVTMWEEWECVNSLGHINREKAATVLSQSIAGLVTFYNVPNHVDAQPNKMFEYMSANLPVIASNFPLWKEIIEGNGCGICVDPYKPEEIAKAINFLIENPQQAESMGAKGREAVLREYNWAVEEKKLFGLYKELLN